MPVALIRIAPGAAIDEAEIAETFIRASGPGGQNVNKVSSAVQIRFDAAASPGLSPAVKERLAKVAGSRMTRDGVVILTAQRFRTQERNREDARERLVELIRKAAEPPPPPRRATRPSKGAVERRLTGKSLRSGVKAGRGRPGSED